jgi:hypothetical protein
MGGTNRKHWKHEKFMVGKPEGRDHLEDVDIDGRILLNGFEKCTWKLTRFIRLGVRPLVNSCEYGNVLVPSSP